MFRITSAKIPDQLIKMKQAGIPVRLITDQRQYRNTNYFWDSYNVDRMYMAGIPIKWKDKSSGQDMHQKSHPDVFEGACGLRILQLDVVVLGHAAGAQLLLEEAVVLPVVRRSIQPEMEQPED